MTETSGKPTVLTDQMINLAKYKWEFLRRNPRYIADYEKLYKTIEENYGDWAPPDGRMIKEEVEFCKKWKIGNALSPNQSYADWTKNEAVKIDSDGTNEAVIAEQMDFHRQMFIWLFPEFLFTRSIMPTEPECLEYDRIIKRKTAPPVVASQGKISVEIDLNYSKSRLLSDYKKFIDEWKPLYEESYKRKVYQIFCKKNDVPAWPEDQTLQKDFEEFYRETVREKKRLYEPKYHFDNFDEYLQVYDLREHDGMSWSKIKKKMGLWDIIVARNYYKAACKLIENGIDPYVNNP